MRQSDSAGAGSGPLPSGGIVTAARDGYKLFIKDDGFDYTGLWEDFRAGRIADSVCLRDYGKREVHRVGYAGRRFIVKIDREISRHLEVKVWRALQGPFYSRQMRAVHRAVRDGCRATPEIYFVAEKEGGWLCRESYSIQEFLEGRVLAEAEDYKPFYPGIVAAFEDLHRHNLALSDLNDHNIMLTPEGVKIIDLSWKGIPWSGKGKDVVILKQLYGIDLPARDFSRRAAARYIRIKHRIRDFFHQD